jgi:hypothetical protein
MVSNYAGSITKDNLLLRDEGKSRDLIDIICSDQHVSLLFALSVFQSWPSDMVFGELL